MASINTNVPALSVQRNLSGSNSSISVSLQRLSSGLRINSARDDAAGLAISERFTTQVRGLSVAVRNANDGISLLQTAEGAIAQVGNNLQRIRELAVQSANGTNSASDRQALNAEASQLLSEIQRVSQTTEFNGRKVLDGSFASQQFQIGANQRQTLSLSIGDLGIDALGASILDPGAGVITGGSASIASLTGGLRINGFEVSTASAQSVNDVLEAINALSGITGVSASRTAETVATARYSSDPFGPPGSVTLNGQVVSLAAGISISEAAEAFNQVASATGVRASVDGFSLRFVAADGRDISFTNADPFMPVLSNFNGLGGFGGMGGGPDAIISAGIRLQGAADTPITVSELSGSTVNDLQLLEGFRPVTTSSQESVVLSGTGGSASYTGVRAGNVVVSGTGNSLTLENVIADELVVSGTNNTVVLLNSSIGRIVLSGVNNVVNATGTAIRSQSSSGVNNSVNSTSPAAPSSPRPPIAESFALDALDISTQEGATRAIQIVDFSLAQVSGERAKLGALQNRLESAVSDLQSARENVAASRSRVLDADYATETAALTRSQILQQAATAILAQANQIPQSALVLLR